MVGRIWEGLINACLNPVSSNTDYVPSCLCITFVPLFPPCYLHFQKGAHRQAGSSGKGKSRCSSAGSGIRGSDGREPDAKVGSVAMRGTT